MPFGLPRNTRQSAAHQHILRETNLALVAEAVINSPDPVSRADVANSTGLARATVSTLVDRLVAGRMVVELPPMALGGAGRPAVPLVPAPRTYLGLGIEISSGFIGVLAVDLTGTVVANRIELGDFRDSDPETVLAQAGAMAHDVMDDCSAVGMTVAGVRLALPGLIHAETGELRFAPNLGWERAQAAPMLGLPGLPIAVANDTKLAALAALRQTPEDSFIYLYSEGGIGGALVIDRRIARGDAEFGHVVVDPSGPACRCGSNGCLEQYAGKTALMTAAGLAPNDPIEDLIAAFHAGEPAAVAAIRNAAFGLGQALGDVLNIVEVPLILLGGSLAAIEPILHEEMVAILNKRVLTARFDPVQVRAAASAARPSMLGGALDVLRDVISDPSRWV